MRQVCFSSRSDAVAPVGAATTASAGVFCFYYYYFAAIEGAVASRGMEA